MSRTVWHKLIGLTVTVCVAGCAALQTPTTEISRAPQESIAVVYRVESPAEKSKQSGELSGPARKTRLLSLKYPHPKCKPGYARVELVVETSSDRAETDSATSRISKSLEDLLPGVKLGTGIDEAWTLDIRKEHVHRLLDDLEQQGFFIEPATSRGSDVTLVVERADSRMARGWSRVSELDRLVRQVREKGALVSHVEPLLDARELLPESNVLPIAGEPTAVAAKDLPLQTIERLPPVVR